MKGATGFAFLGVTLLLGSVLQADDAVILGARFSPQLSAQQRNRIRQLRQRLKKVVRAADPKLALETLFREHAKAFGGAETDFLYFLLQASDAICKRGLVSEDRTRESAELFKSWWSIRTLGVNLIKGPISTDVRRELTVQYPYGRDVVRLWKRYDYPSRS